MSFPRYPKYKESGVEWLGQVPEHWEVMTLRRCLLEHRQGYYSEAPYLDAGVKLLRITDLREHGEIDFTDCPHVAEEEGIKEFLLKESDFVFARTGGAGTFGLVPSITEPVAYASYLIRFRFDATANADFLKCFFQSLGFQGGVLQNIHGGVNKNIHAEDIKNQRFALPPLSEQTAIAGFLDQETAKIDGLIAEQERLIELLKEKRQAVISHAVTKGLNRDDPMKDSGIEWLGQVPAHWEIVGMTKYLASVVDYRGRTPTKVEEGIFLLTARNIREGKVDYANSEEFIPDSEYENVMRRGKPEIGDVLFTTEAPLGQVANMDRTDVALAQRVIKFRGQTDVLDNYFLKYWLMGHFAQADMEQLATGSTALGIKGSKVVQLRLCLPPYDEQKQIAYFLDVETDQLDTLTAEAQKAITLLQERRSALISAAVTGQIDVRGIHHQEAA